MKERIAYFDHSKLICIWLMVCCHAGQGGLFQCLAYQFHMPLFFIISGFLFRPKDIITQLKSLGIPILCYTLAMLPYRWIIGFLSCENLHSITDYVNVILVISKEMLVGFIEHTNVSPFPGYWFVLTLLLIRIMMEFEGIRRYKNLLAGLCVLYCIIEPYIQVFEIVKNSIPYHIIACLPFYVFGMIVKEKKIDITSGSYELKLGLTALWFIISLIQGRVGLVEQEYGLSYLLFFCNACLGCYLLTNFCRLLPQRKWVQTLSNGTLFILGVHGMFLAPLLSFINRFLGISSSYIPLFIGTIIIAMCYLPIKRIEMKYPVLLGKSH